MFEYTRKAYGVNRDGLNSNSLSEQLSLDPLAKGRIPKAEIESGQVVAKAIPRTFFQGINSDTTPSKAEFIAEITRQVSQGLEECLLLFCI